MLFMYVTISVVVSTSSLVSPYIIGDFIDQLIYTNGVDFIYRYFALFAGINLATLFLGYISGRLYVRLQTQLSFELNRDYIKKLQCAPIGFISKQDTVYINQRINNDANTLIIFCIGIIQNVLVNMLIVVFALSLLFIIHPLLAGVLLAVAVFYFVFYTIYKNILYKASHNYQESQSKFFAKLNEQMFNIRFIKMHGLFTHFIGRLDHSFDGLMRHALIRQRAGYIFSGLDKLVLIVAQMVLLLFGGMEIVAGRLTIGRFIIISSYFNMMLGAIRYFFSLGKTVQNCLVSYNRLNEYNAIEHEPNGELMLQNITNIQLRGISFAYGKQAVLNDINYTMKRGKIYTIAGPNGAGKSTLIDVMIGLQIGKYAGQVLYNGTPADMLDMYKLRNNLIGISEQEPILLADTISRNLDLNSECLSEARIADAEKLIDILGLRAYIDGLPDKLNTIVNESTTNLSGGEKQKISILRTILKNPDVLILDEPTSALDTTSRVALKNYLQTIKDDKIIIVITHDNDFSADKDDTLDISQLVEPSHNKSTGV